VTSAGGHAEAWALLALPALLLVGCPVNEQPADDDSAAPTDDDDTTDALTPVDLPSCMIDTGCAYVFGCGHRGTTLFAPENTLLGFEMALQYGVEVVEVDVRPTADEVLVLMHDSSVDRTTNGSGDVDEMTLAEVQSLVAVSAFDDIEDQPIPTFAEFLERFQHRVLVNVDAKTSRYDLIVADIEAAQMQAWCYVQVESTEDGLVMRGLDPSIAVMPDVADEADLELYEATLQPELIEVPWQLSEPALVTAADALGIRVAQNSLGPADAAAAVHDANGDDPCVAFEAIWSLGSTLIQTDAPHLLMPCLQALNGTAGYEHTAR
jgi:glycerophosphoryl diester phosphodiesterase